jgi:hypothetical protein
MSDTGNPPVEGQAEGAETKATGRIDAFVFERPEAGILEGKRAGGRGSARRWAVERLIATGLRL